MIPSVSTDGRVSTERKMWLALLGIAITVALLIGSNVVLTLPVSFDGALNAQVAMNLVEHGRYGLGGANFRDFDHRVQTGPTVVLPVSFVFFLLGVGNSVAQLPNLVYFVLFFVVATHYAYRHGGVVGALIALGLLVQTPGIGPLGLGLYGEIPALFFFVVGLLLLDHVHDRAQTVWAACAGLSLGLAILTKVVMLIPVVATVLVVLALSITRRSLHVRHLAALAVGVCVPVAVFELIKILVLGPTLWAGWWSVMVRRAAGQGLPIGMPDTPGVVPKATTHLGILSDSVGVPVWCLVLFLLVPTFLVALLWRRASAADSPKILVPVSVVSLWLAATSFVGWWLVLTPTSRAWPRRILIGLLLQELFVSIVLGWGIQTVARLRREQDGSRRRSSILLTGTMTAALFLVVGSLLAHNLPRLEWHGTESQQRRDIETVAEAMKKLPPTSLIYGIGWYRAPVLTLLTGREIKDFNQFPAWRYETPLAHVYLAVDSHLAYAKPEWVREILARSIFSTVARSGDCALYQLETVLPYPPIPEPVETHDLKEKISLEKDDYPFVGGLGERTPNGRLAGPVAGFLLDRHDLGCLLVDIWVSPKVPGRPTLEVRIDHLPVRVGGPVAGRVWKHQIVLGEDVEPESPGSLVELWVFADLQETPFSLWSSNHDLVVVRDIGFVPCSDPGD